MSLIRLRKWLPFLLLLASFLQARQAFAVFELSVQPRKGGQSLRFEESTPGSLLRNEEATISVTSDVGVQYRIAQVLYQPLTNEMGQTIPQDALVAFSPSSSLGTLRTELETPVTLGQHDMYTSNGAGESDSFVMAYSVRVPADQAGGVYRGRLTFTAEPVTPVSGVTQQVVNLDLKVEIRKTFRLSIAGAHGEKELSLGKVTKDRLSAEGALIVNVEGNAGATYRLIQRLEQPLTTASGRMLDEEAFQCRLNGSSPQAVSFGPSQVYSSENGQPEPLQLVYTLTPPLEEKAGAYRGMLSIRAESSSPAVPQQPVLIPVSVDIEPIFDLDVDMTGSGLHFGKLSAWNEEQSRTVVLNVKSNLGEPYDVLQLVSRKMTNETGKTLPPEQFVVSVEGPAIGDPLKGERPVDEGEGILYTSDAKGSPARLNVNYKLRVPAGTKAGNYTSEIKYSLTTK